MKKMLMIMCSLCVASVLFAQGNARHVQNDYMQQRINENVARENFKKFYYDYMDLVMHTYNPPAAIQEERLLRLSQAYMQIPTGERISSICRYFQSKWVIGEQVISVRDFLKAQIVNIPADKQANYVAFLEQLDKDLALHNGNRRLAPDNRI